MKTSASGNACHGALFALACLGLLALPATASAQPPPTRAIQITLRGTHGYGIELSGNVEGPHSTVTLSTGRPFSSAHYSVPGTITPTGVRASFGSLGSVSLRLAQYRMQQVKLSKSCRPPGSPAISEVRIGTFVGRVRFHGEHGFTTASAHRVHGAVGEPLPLLAATLPGGPVHLFCLGGPGEEPGKGKAPKPVILHAASSDGAITFFATSNPASASAAKTSASTGYAPIFSGPTTFIAVDSERRGAMRISRTVISRAPAADFVFDSALSTATVTPPSPFSGSASFQRGADGSAGWSGSLAVSYPGMPKVSLVAPQLEVSLGREGQVSSESCTEFPGNRPCSSTGA